MEGDAKMNSHKRKLVMLRYLDISVILILLALGAISYVAVSSAKINDPSIPSIADKQLMWYAVGFVVIILSLFIDYRRFEQFAYWFYGLGVLLLLLLYIPGVTDAKKGARSWFELGPVNFQPSELMKIFVIFAMAKVLANSKEIKLKSWKTLGKTALIFLVPFVLIYKQPDLGTALIFLAIVSSMLLVAGLDWRIILALVLLAAVCVGAVFWLYLHHMPVLEKILGDHQIKRIDTFLDPTADVSNSGWQVTQGMIAIGSGQLLGKGYQQGTQIRGSWVPEPHNDFIFTVIGEEFGFVGASILLCLFIYLIYRMVHIALAAQDFFGTYVVAGVIGMIVFQVYQNIGMTVGLMPVTGINLPFISYGGSSLVATMLAIGIVLNVGMRRKKILFYSQND